MKVIILIAAIAATMTFVSCEKNGNEGLIASESMLKVHASLGDIGTKATLSSFPNQSEIGLFITTGTLGSNYDGVSGNNNVKSTYDGRLWTQEPAVYLSTQNATVFAYYPYAIANNNGAVLPVEHKSQTDYLYGTHSGGQAALNNGNPNINLTMKHALSLVQFRMCKQNYTGSATVNKIEISNKVGKTILFSQGTMNAITGSITNTSGKNESAAVSMSYPLPITISSNPAEYPRIMVLPVDEITNEGDIQILFTIDGRLYTYNVPAGTKWEKGKVNTYIVTLSGVELNVNNVIIENWIAGVNGSAELS